SACNAESSYFRQRTRDETGLRVIAIAETVAYTGRDGDDIFQRASVFHAENVRAAVNAKFRTMKESLHGARRAVAFTGANHHCWNTQRDFARKAGFGKRGHTIRRSLFTQDAAHCLPRLKFNAFCDTQQNCRM